MLNVDNAVSCQSGSWSLFAMLAGGGLVSVSFGIPLYLLVTMRKVMAIKVKEVRLGEKKRAVAMNEFGQNFDYVAGNFRVHA